MACKFILHSVEIPSNIYKDADKDSEKHWIKLLCVYNILFCKLYSINIKIKDKIFARNRNRLNFHIFALKRLLWKFWHESLNCNYLSASLVKSVLNMRSF